MAFAPALTHGSLEAVAAGVWVVQGNMVMGILQELPRSMTVLTGRPAGSVQSADVDSVVICNSLRLDDAGLAQLDALGEVCAIVRLGSHHGRDDAFYAHRYPDALVWSAPGMTWTGQTEFAYRIRNLCDLPRVGEDDDSDDDSSPKIDAHGDAAAADGPSGDSSSVAFPVPGVSVFVVKKCPDPEVALVVELPQGRALVTCDLVTNFVDSLVPNTSRVVRFFMWMTGDCWGDCCVGGVWVHMVNGWPKKRTIQPDLERLVNLLNPAPGTDGGALPFLICCTGHGPPHSTGKVGELVAASVRSLVGSQTTQSGLQ
jgi:hypothetical protein